MTTICIGPICIPLWNLWFLLILLLKPIYTFLRRIFFKEAEDVGKQKKDALEKTEKFPSFLKSDVKSSPFIERPIKKVEDVIAELNQLAPLFIDGKNSQRVPVLFYYSAAWCGPCKRMHPFVENQLTKKYECVFVKIDADNCSDSRMNVAALPTFELWQFSKSQLDKVEDAGAVVGASPDKLENLLLKYCQRIS